MKDRPKSRAGIIQLTLLGVVFEGAFLGTYFIVARLQLPEIAKSLVLGLAAFTIACLIVFGTIKASGISDLLIFPLVLALGYSVDFAVLEWMFSGGRLKDFQWWSLDYLQGVGAVVGFLYGAYLLLTFATFGASYLFNRLGSSSSA